jgi:hypothetical protein
MKQWSPAVTTFNFTSCSMCTRPCFSHCYIQDYTLQDYTLLGYLVSSDATGPPLELRLPAERGVGVGGVGWREVVGCEGGWVWVGWGVGGVGWGG